MTKQLYIQKVEIVAPFNVRVILSDGSELVKLTKVVAFASADGALSRVTIDAIIGGDCPQR